MILDQKIMKKLHRTRKTYVINLVLYMYNIQCIHN